MKFIIKQGFNESVPDNKKELLYKKLKKIGLELRNNKNKFYELPKGFWGRKIEGCKNNIYKFRLNSGDRILFTYTEDCNINRSDCSNSIILIKYCVHDDQIRDGRRIANLNFKKDQLHIDIDRSKYVKKELDYKIEKDYSDYSIDLNESISYLVNENQYIDLMKENSKNYYFYLNEEQYRCVNSDGPFLLSGSAGSGKTTIGLHKLLAAGSDKKIIYITYTNKLKNYSKQFFNYFNTNSNNVDFYTINELGLNLSGLNDSNLVGYSRFKEWVFSNNGKHADVYQFDPQELWSEIRGIIKGFMGPSWIKNSDITNIDLNTDAETKSQLFSLLLKNGIINEIQNRYYWNNFNFDLKGIKKLKGLFLNEGIDLKLITTILDHLYNNPTEIINEKTYLELSEKYSIHSKKKRTKIYKFACKYDKWLKNNKYFDDNDLALEAFRKIKNSDKKDFIVVDEVQDFTELQIYFINKLIINKSNLFFSGDFHQIINPTYFSFSRLKNYYYINSIDVKEQNLRKNYRSQERIVGLANRLNRIRSDFIGKLSGDYIEDPLRKGTNVKLLEHSSKNKIDLLNILKERAYAAIVVSTDEEKNLLKKDFPVSRLFTVQEIKGLEYNYIISFNILSNYKKEYNEILEGVHKHNQKYRYFFNLFYVAITRAKDNLLLYEESCNHPLLNMIKDNYIKYDKFSEKKLNLEKFSTPKEWFREGKKLEENGNFNQAIYAYEKSFNNIGIKRVKAKILEQKGLFKEAALKMLEIDTYSEPIEIHDIYFTKKQIERSDDTILNLAFNIWSIIYEDKVDEIVREKNIDLIEEIENCNYLKEDVKSRIIKSYLIRRQKNFNKKCNKIDKAILNLIR